MVLTKLKEALAEIDTQIACLREVEIQLRAMIAKLSGGQVSGQMPPYTAAVASIHQKGRDSIDDMVDILRAEGSPLHITTLAERLSVVRGTRVLRTKVEPGINRHIANVKHRRIEKFGPSTYGLPEWRTPLQERLTDVA